MEGLLIIIVWFIFLFIASGLFTEAVKIIEFTTKDLKKQTERESLIDQITTWSCHICGRIREDENISVHTYPLKTLKGGECNVRYCNDNFKCSKEVLKWAERGEFPR